MFYSLKISDPKRAHTKILIPIYKILPTYTFSKNANLPADCKELPPGIP